MSNTEAMRAAFDDAVERLTGRGIQYHTRYRTTGLEFAFEIWKAALAQAEQRQGMSAWVGLTDWDKQEIHNQTGAGHGMICLVEDFILTKQAEKAQPSTPSALLEALERIADPRNTHFARDAQVVAREAIEAHKKGQI